MFPSCLKQEFWLQLAPLLLLLQIIICSFVPPLTTVVAQEIYNESKNSVGTVTTPHSYFGGVDHDTYIAWYESLQLKYTGNAFVAQTEKPVTTNDTISSSMSNMATALLNGTSTYDKEGVAVHWYVDELYLYIGVATRAQNGWVALGFAEAGGMKGSDIVLYETSKPDQLTDSHVLDFKAAPIIDICQDWSFINSVNDDGFLIFEGKRLLDTMDGQDHRIINDTEIFIPAQRIIAAWGNDTDIMNYHGTTNRVRGAIRIYSTVDAVTEFRSFTESADGSFVLLARNHTIENITTAYVSFCFDWDTDIVPQGIPSNTNIYAMALDVVLDDESAPFLHHATLIVSFESEVDECIRKNYGLFLHAWTPGTFPLILPSDVGIEMGPNDIAIRSFKVELHYNNPMLLNGFRDNSGIKIFYKYAKPKNLAGVLPLADAFNKLTGRPLEGGTVRYDFTCDEQCSTFSLEGEPVTVIGEFFHMHQQGTSAVQYQIRNGQVIRQANVNFFDFDQAGVLNVRQRPYQIYPGDILLSSCIYQSDGDTIFGLASNDEMCITAILYYPLKLLFNELGWTCIYDLVLSTCNATLSSSIITAPPTVDDVNDTPPVVDDNNSGRPILLNAVDPTLERTFGYNNNNADQCYEMNNVTKEQGNVTNTTSQSMSTKSTGELLFLIAQYLVSTIFVVLL